MSLETAQYIHQLNASNPSGADRLKDGDDHLRMIKAALKNTFPGIQGPLDASITHTMLNGLAALFLPSKVCMLWLGAPSSVPTGWVILDGSTVQLADGSSFQTPDTRGKVIAGVSAAHALMSTYGQDSKTITTDAAGQHGHTASTSAAGQHSHGGSTGSTGLSIDQIPGHSHYEFSNSSGTAGTLQNNAESAPDRAGETQGGSSAPTYFMAQSGGQATLGRTSTTGGGQGHAHGISQDGSHTHPVSIDASGNHAHSATIDVTQATIAFYIIMKL